MCEHEGDGANDNKTSWIAGRLAFPYPNNTVTTRYCAPAGQYHVIQYFRLDSVGNNQRIPILGFNLFELDKYGKLLKLFLEFDSLAYSIDTPR